jgi:hypothetical protein
MRSPSIFVVVASSLSFAGCNSMTPAQIANVSCNGAEAGAAVAVAVTTDANTGANATKAAAQTQQTASAIQKAIGDACPIVVTSVNAINASIANGVSK